MVDAERYALLVERDIASVVLPRPRRLSRIEVVIKGVEFLAHLLDRDGALRMADGWPAGYAHLDSVYVFWPLSFRPTAVILTNQNEDRVIYCVSGVDNHNM